MDLPLPEKPLAEMTSVELQDWRNYLVDNYYEWIASPDDRVKLKVACGYTKMSHLYSLANKRGKTSKRGRRSDDEGSEAYDVERLKLREDPAETRFSERDDEYLTKNFGQRRSLEEIALATRHTEIAMAYRARHLGLRNFCKYWPLEKVLGWMHPVTQDQLELWGMLLYPITDKRGRVVITLASSSSLSRMVADPVINPLLVSAGADKFFMAELAELWQSNHEGRIFWEPSCWVSHAHRCLNPRAGEVFGANWDGSGGAGTTDMDEQGKDVRPYDITAGASTWRTPLEHLGVQL